MKRGYKLEIISQQKYRKEKKVKNEHKPGEYAQYLTNFDHDLPKEKPFEGLKAVIYGQHHRSGGLNMYYSTQLTMKKKQYNKGQM